MKCKNCGGDMIGDGYISVIHCEYADEDKYCFREPDADPIYCSFESNEVTIHLCKAEDLRGFKRSVR